MQQNAGKTECLEITKFKSAGSTKVSDDQKESLINQKIVEEQQKTGFFVLKIDDRKFVFKQRIQGNPKAIDLKDRDYRVILQPKDKIGLSVVLTRQEYLALAYEKFFPKNKSASCVVM